MKGKVFLVGAGPGNPGLLTLRGRDCLRLADVVVYDALINPRLMDWTRPNAVKIFVGKRGRQHAMEQHQINDLLVRQARRGRVVARLKGGDPFLFGRGGEEALHLYENNIPFEVVPGVSSASGCAAFSGIPLTDRHLASMVTMVTGHEGAGKKQAPVEWSRISRQSTLVIFMGLEQLPLITERLLRHNWRADTPVAVIQWGSTPAQRVVEGTIRTIADEVEKAGLASPALVIAGKIVSLRKKLRWYDVRPLSGKRIVITRARDQAAEFAALLEEAGAEVISFPTIQILPPRTWDVLDKSLRDLQQFDWILFSSVHGVRGFFARLRAQGGDVRDLHGIRLGAIGPKTSLQLTQRGLKVDAFPDEYRGEALANVIGQVKGCRVLLARAEEARDVIPKTLEQRGAKVVIAPVYRTVKIRRVARELKKRLLDGEADVITFTSSSTVDGFMQHFSARQRKKIFEHAKAAVIGPITGHTLREYGVRAAVRPSRYTIEALARAIVKHLS